MKTGHCRANTESVQWHTYTVAANQLDLCYVFHITVYFFLFIFFISLAFSFVLLCTMCTILILNK